MPIGIAISNKTKVLSLIGHCVNSQETEFVNQFVHRGSVVFADTMAWSLMPSDALTLFVFQICKCTYLNTNIKLGVFHAFPLSFYMGAAHGKGPPLLLSSPLSLNHRSALA